MTIYNKINFNDLSPSSQHNFLKQNNSTQLSIKFPEHEKEFFDKLKRERWDARNEDAKISLIEQHSDSDLSNMFNDKSLEYFERIRKYYQSKQAIEKGHKVRRDPPKDKLIQSAKKDLTLVHAIGELIDNSIDGFIRNRISEDINLKIIIELDPDTKTGFYYDNAGGIPNNRLGDCLIMGATDNYDPITPQIGGFGMGGKKALFHISDGIMIHSEFNGEGSYYATIPENWENIDGWDVIEGISYYEHEIEGQKRNLKKETVFLFDNLLPQITTEKIESMVSTLEETYNELFTGDNTQIKLESNINIKIPWSSTLNNMAQPRKYVLKKRFEDRTSMSPFLEPSYIDMSFELVIGLKTNTPGDYHIDVYGNYRLFDKGLNKQLGLSPIRGTSNTLIRGKLFINGPSEGIPWDQHKRTYIEDHQSALWIKDKFKKVLEKYKVIAKKIGSAEKGVNTYLLQFSFNEIDITDELTETHDYGVTINWTNLPKFVPITPPVTVGGGGGLNTGGGGLHRRRWSKHRRRWSKHR